MIWLHLLILLGAIAIGAKVGGIGIGFAGGLGVLLLGLTGATVSLDDLPLTVVAFIMVVIVAVAAMQVAGGMDYLVELADRVLRANPKRLTVLGPVVIYLLTLTASTGQASFATMPVIVEVGKENDVRPQRALTIGVAASLVAITASPISASVLFMSSLLEDGDTGWDYLLLLAVVMPATLLAVLATSVLYLVWDSARGRTALSTLPEYAERLRAGEARRPQPHEARDLPPGARRSVVIFVVGLVAVLTVAGPPAPEWQAAASTAVPSATGETTSTGRRSLLRLLRMAGPAFVVGCRGFGPGNLTTSIQAGSGFGYQLVWVVVAATILMLTLTDMSVRIGIKSPVSLLTAVKQRLGTWVGYLAGCAVFVITLMFSVGNAVGSGLALSMLFGGAPVFWSVVCTLAVAVVLVLRNVYGVMERVMIVAMALMALAFVLSAVLARPDWWLAVEGLVPRVPEGSTTIVIALIGTCLSANAAFYSAYGTRERRRTESQYRDITVADTVPGIVAPGVMTALVILVAAKVFDRPGEIASTIGQLSSVFEPLAGSVGTWVFSLGFFAAAFSAMTANATAGGTMLSDALGKGASASTKAARIFSGVILTVGLVVTAIFQASPVQLIVIAQSLTVLTAPVLCFLLVYMATKAEFMGRLRNRWWQVALGAVAFVVLGVFWVQLVIGLVS